MTVLSIGKNKAIQRKTPRAIPQKQITLFLLHLGPIRHPKYIAKTEHQKPPQKAISIGGTKIIENINTILKKKMQ